MRAIAAIAWNTFREAVRNRILYIILIFAILLMASSGIVSDLTIADHSRVVRDFGLACINFFGMAIAIIVGIGLVYNELDKKSIYTIVSKPIARWQFLLGKYFGLLLTIYVNILVMTVFFLTVTNYMESTTDEKLEQILLTKDATGQMVEVPHLAWAKAKFLGATAAKSVGISLANVVGLKQTKTANEIVWVVLFTALELAIITAFAVFYSSFSTPTLSAIFTIMTFIAGRLNQDIWLYAQKVLYGSELKDGAQAADRIVTWLNQLPVWLNHQFPTLGAPLLVSFGAWLNYWGAMAACAIVPNLGAFKESTLAMPGDSMLGRLCLTGPYTIAYTATILMLSILIFRSRNFK